MLCLVAGPLFTLPPPSVLPSCFLLVACSCTCPVFSSSCACSGSACAFLFLRGSASAASAAFAACPCSSVSARLLRLYRRSSIRGVLPPSVSGFCPSWSDSPPVDLPPLLDWVPPLRLRSPPLCHGLAKGEATRSTLMCDPHLPLRQPPSSPLAPAPASAQTHSDTSVTQHPAVSNPKGVELPCVVPFLRQA